MKNHFPIEISRRTYYLPVLCCHHLVRVVVCGSLTLTLPVVATMKIVAVFDWNQILLTAPCLPLMEVVKQCGSEMVGMQTKTCAIDWMASTWVSRRIRRVQKVVERLGVDLQHAAGTSKTSTPVAQDVVVHDLHTALASEEN